MKGITVRVISPTTAVIVAKVVVVDASTSVHVTTVEVEVRAAIVIVTRCLLT